MGDSNDRAGLKAMLALIASEAGLAQEQCATITNYLDLASGAVEALAANQQSAGALAVAAVGSDSDLPDSATNMVQMTSRLGELVNDIRAAVENGQAQTASCARTARRVATEANTYAQSF
jgi:hypothetical protein